MIDKTLIIAEAGVNHNGDISIAKKLVDAASKAGVDFVKFQTFIAKNLTTASAPKAKYQQTAKGGHISQQKMLSDYEMSEKMHLVLQEHCKKRGVGFLSSAFDIQDLDFLNALGLGLFKVPSGEISNLPYLRHLGAFGAEVILSSGLASLADIELAIDALEKSGTKRRDITLLHCNTEYPTPMEDVNLKAIPVLSQSFGVKVGYSDHTLGVEIPLAAVALGATVIEKHFTLDRNLPGPDHKASLLPGELNVMVEGIRNIELAIGDGVKKVTASELKNKPAVRKSLVAKRFIAAGELYSENNVAAKRPGLGISPMFWDEVMGRKAPRSFDVDEMIEF